MREKKLEKLGMHASDTALLAFQDVRVPDSAVLGQIGKGFYHIMWELQGERLIGAAGCVAGAQRAFDRTLAYAMERQAFGRSIGHFQVIRHKFAAMATKIEASRSLVYSTAWRFANGEYPVREISMAKLHASQMCCEVADECLQIFGGAGYMREYKIERAWRDLRLNRIGAGTDEIMLDVIGRSYGSDSRKPDIFRAMGVLDDKVAIVTGSARGIGRATAELLSEHGAKVIINDLDSDLAEQAASEIAGETAVFAGDLTKGDAPDALIQTAIDAWGKIDIIVNNAGYTIDAPIHKMSDDAFQRMLDIHTIVPFRVIRAAAPHLREPAKARARRGPRGVPQDRQRVLDLRHHGQRRPGQLRGRQVRRRRPDQDAGQGVGPVQDQRQRGRVRLDRDAPDGLQGRREHDGDRRAEGPARHPGPDALDGAAC